MDLNIEEIIKDNRALREKVKESSNLLEEIRRFLLIEPDDELLREAFIEKINLWHGLGK